MTRQIVFRRAAQAEFEDAAAWYDKARSGLGDEFIFEIEQSLIRAAASPERYAITFGDVRRAVTRRFPYAIYFRVRANRLIVIAVFHGRRDPAVWQRRAAP
jgi:plasmid stabilization system protein ParE